MTLNLEYQCWSWDHIQWIIFVAIPILTLWVIGLPLIALWILVKNRKNLHQPPMQSYFLILYQGFKPEVFYWEFIGALRKFIILSIHSLLNIFSINYKITISVFCLVAFYYLQKRMMPFKTKNNNELDLLALKVGIVSLYSGIILAIEVNVHSVFYNLTVSMIIVFNAYFLLNWLRILLLCMQWKSKKYIFLLNLMA